MVLGGAPAHYASINFAALALALGTGLLVARRRSAMPWRVLLWIAPVGLTLTLLAGLEIDGVSRWIGRAPLAIHAGMLLLPLFCALVACRFDPLALAASFLVALMLALQPDRGTALAFACAMAVMAWQHRTFAAAMGLVIALLALAVTILQPDSLAPVPFVEAVLQDAWRENADIAAALALALAAAIAGPFAAGRDGAVVGAFLGGLTLASLLGPYPTPLIGYGVAPILGCALALGFIRRGTPSAPPRTVPDCRT